MTILYETFAAVDIRVGTITAAEPFPQACRPAYRLTIDFGPERLARQALLGPVHR